jgi:5-formyltetrahydrofolate cyclo-ligase
VGHDLVSGVWGIREPAAHCPRSDAKQAGFMLVPGVAFTGRGERLGYGGGYYDRLLMNVPLARRVGAGFASQVVEVLPTDAHDQRVHVVVTERETLVA